MSRTNRNFVIAYLLFVVLPLLGLVGVLKAGRKLAAPISIDGVWSVQAEQNASQSLPCKDKDALAALLDQSFVISQSGSNFTMAVPSAGKPSLTASGTIEGNTLRASLRPALQGTAQSGCGVQEIGLVATLNTNTGSKSLNGAWTINHNSLGFHAWLQPATASYGGH
jgi:hypothetical protein